MLVAIDGACKRNGEPDCSSLGVAWIETEAGELLYITAYESTGSTSQRGEINGLLSALEYAKQHASADEIISIVTDSEYLFNTVSKEWLLRWHDSDWKGADGNTVKNADLWKKIHAIIVELNATEDRVFMQWTKGHIMAYTPGNVKKAMLVDNTGVELFSRILAMGNRPADRDRIIDDFINQRVKHGHIVPGRDICFDWCMANVMADCLAGYLIGVLDKVIL